LGTCDVLRQEVSVVEVRMELLGETREAIGRNDSQSRRIVGILDNLRGWERTGKARRRGAYGPQRVYCRAAQEEFDELD